MRPIVKILIINGIFMLVILAIAEWAARKLFDNAFLLEGNQYVFFEFDEQLGWRGKANTKGMFTRGEEFSTQVNTNRFGMREREVRKKKEDGVIRIAVLGDSFTWGFGVETDEIYTAVMQRELGSRFEVLNFGVSGYGRGQQWLQLESQVADFSADLVLIMAYPGNDLYDNLADDLAYEVYPRPRFSLDDKGQLVVLGQPVKPPLGDFSERLFMRHTGEWMGVYMRSYLFRVLYQVFASMQKSWEQNPADYLNPIYQQHNRQKLKEAARVETAILKKIRSFCRAQGCKVLEAIATTSEQVRPALQDELRKRFPDIPVDWEQPARILTEAATRAGVDIYDLAPVLKAAEERGERTHREKDFHWTPLGNRLVGETLAPVVRNMMERR